jgi:hypothetical protein
LKSRYGCTPTPMDTRFASSSSPTTDLTSIEGSKQLICYYARTPRFFVEA